MEENMLVCPNCGGIFEINPRDKLEEFSCRCIHCCKEYILTVDFWNQSKDLSESEE